MAQPSGLIDQPYHSEERRWFTDTAGRSPNLVPMSSAAAAPAAATAAAAKSETAKIEGSSPGLASCTFSMTSAGPPNALHIADRNSRVAIASLHRYVVQR